MAAPFYASIIPAASGTVKVKLLDSDCRILWNIFARKGKALPSEKGGSVTSPKGGVAMPITLTFHILGYTITVTVKSRNRHSAK